ncbi:hypothetical protein [Sphingomonas sp. TF3]|uniref:hypothetical protein n=1 Tax=Sphingomonas sp. TF3 TaxID=2495580 RepID=UPI00163CD232|nr:hypothetical protein [Sphingomonas sp. TF3]
MAIVVGIIACVIAFAVWEVLQLLKQRRAAVRRGKRRQRNLAYQQAWDAVFGRGGQRRLTVQPPEADKE